MSEVWKYPLSPHGETIVDMPRGRSQLLSVGAQEEEIVLWAVVNPEAPKRARHFWTALTGEELPPNLGVFLGTVYLDQYVVHVWEMTRPMEDGNEQ